jgi:hypothetical protein
MSSDGQPAQAEAGRQDAFTGCRRRQQAMAPNSSSYALVKYVPQESGPVRLTVQEANFAGDSPAGLPPGSAGTGE